MEKYGPAHLANSWLTALLCAIGITAVIVFIGSGNAFAVESYYSDSEFNVGAALGGAIGFLLMSLPIIGGFHITARVLEAKEEAATAAVAVAVAETDAETATA